MTFCCELLAGSVTLSDEHRAFYWQDLAKINQYHTWDMGSRDLPTQ